MPDFDLEDIVALNKKMEQMQNKLHLHSKNQWLSDYAEDIFESMLEAEKRRRPMYFKSQQLNERKKMLELCQHVARAYKSSRSALHLAIYYMDRFMDFYNIRPSKLYLVVLVCLHIAWQIEDTDASVPRYKDMNVMVKDMHGMSYTLQEYKAVERKVLIHFDFELMRPTTAHFVELLACGFFTGSDYTTYMELCATHDALQRYASYEDMLAAQDDLLLRMADHTLSIHRFGNEPPSLMAAVCIGAVRQMSCLPTRWTPYLTLLTSYPESVIEPYVEILILYDYYKTTSCERLGLLIKELEEGANFSSIYMEYMNSFVNQDSGYGTTIENESSAADLNNSSIAVPNTTDVKAKMVNIISVKQIRKPNTDLSLDDLKPPELASVKQSSKRRRDEDPSDMSPPSTPLFDLKRRRKEDPTNQPVDKTDR